MPALAAVPGATIATAALPTGRAELLDEIGRLRRARGAAVLLDQREFSGADRLAAAELALLAQDDADLVRRERELAETDQREAGALATLRSTVTAADTARLAAIASAQMAFDFCVIELAKALDLTEKIRVAGVQLRAGPSSLALEHRVAERRISLWLAAGLTGIGRVQEFGDLTWHGTPPICADWAAAERAAAGPAVAILLGEGAAVAEPSAPAAPASLNEPSGPTAADIDNEPEGDE